MTVQRLNEDIAASAPMRNFDGGYDRAQPPGIVHLGIGAFHRAHQAVYFDSLMAAGEGGWMIRGVSLRSRTVGEQLNPQDGFYTVNIKDGSADTYRIVRSVADVLFAPEAPQRVVDAMAAPEVQLVTLTVTEKGYCLDPASGMLRLDHPQIRSDLENIDSPQSALGFLVAGLKARRAAGLPPFTVLSCDNLPTNGALLRAAVLALATEVDPSLADWISDHGAFPSSMVDRIVPPTTETDIKRLAEIEGYRDCALVKTEPFSQWVIENNFCANRPPLEHVGVQFTDDIDTWEKIKLRLLNGAHSAMAYLGWLAGFEFVHQAVAEPRILRLVERLWDEMAPTLDVPPGFVLSEYRQELLARFRNAALQHQTFHIAMDGSVKISQRIVSPLRERLAQGLDAPALALALAAWMRWQSGKDETGKPYPVEDPYQQATRKIVENAKGDSAAWVSGLLAIEAIFDSSLRKNEQLCASLTENLEKLRSVGAMRTIEPG